MIHDDIEKAAHWLWPDATTALNNIHIPPTVIVRGVLVHNRFGDDLNGFQFRPDQDLNDCAVAIAVIAERGLYPEFEHVLKTRMAVDALGYSPTIQRDLFEAQRLCFPLLATPLQLMAAITIVVDEHPYN